MSSQLNAPPGLLARFTRKHSGEFGLALAIVAVLAVTAMIDDSYLQKPGYNAKEILRQASLLGIFSLGAAIVIISGGIDLSSGAMIAMSSTVCASIMIWLAPADQYGNPDTADLALWITAAAIVGTLLVAVMVGSFHAWLITAVNLPPFVATLASLVGLRSLARVLVPNITLAASQAENPQGTTKIYIYDETFGLIGKTWWVPLTVFLTLCFVVWLLMSRTVVGRHLYAMGGNEQAARLSGIRTDRLKWLAYCIGTVTASIAGILYTSEVATANPTTLAMGYELNAIAAAVVGGCSLAGGIGTVGGTMLGSLFLRVVIDSVAKVVKENSDDFEGLIVGILVVLAVAFNELRSGSRVAKKFFEGPLGTVSIGILAVLSSVVATVVVSQNKLTTGLATGGLVLLVLTIRKLAER